MNNDLDNNNCRAKSDEIQAAYKRIEELEPTPQQIETPEALEHLEPSLREAMENLTALLLQKQLQASLDTNEAKAREAELIKPGSGRLKTEGLVPVWI